MPFWSWWSWATRRLRARPRKRERSPFYCSFTPRLEPLEGRTLLTTRTWTGGGTTNNWMGANNWGGTAPVAGDDLVFPSGAARLSPFNNFTAGTSFRSITIDAGSYTFTGNSIVLTNSLNITATGAVNAIGFNITLNQNVTFSMASGAYLSLTGVVSGSGGWTETGAGIVALSGSNTFTGGVTVNQGTVSVLNANALSASTSEVQHVAITATSGTYSLSFNGATTSSLAYNASSTQVSTALNGLSSIGGVGGTATVSSYTTGSGTVAYDVTFGGALTGSNQPLMSATPAGGAAVNVSTLVDGPAGATVASGAALELDGGIIVSAGSLTLNGGTLRNISGNNTWAGPVALPTSSTISTSGGQLALSGVVSGAGGVTKSGAGTLVLSGANTYSGATTINGGVVNVQNSVGLGSTSGGTTLASGATLQTQGNITVAGEALTLNGGTVENVSDGNIWTGSVALAADTTMTGAAGTLNITGVVSGSGGITKTGAGTLMLSGTNTFTGAVAVNVGALTANNSSALGATSAGTTVASGATLQVQQNMGNEPVTLNGSGVGGNGALRNINGFNSWTGNISLATATTIGVDSGSLLSISGVVSGGSSAALTKVLTGNLNLTGANTYSGATTISTGVVNVQNSAALGATSTGTTVADGATLQLQGGVSVGTESLILNGNGVVGIGSVENISGSNAWSGTISLASATTIGVVAGQLTFTGTVSGSGALTKSGPGTLILTNANTYTGATTLSLGILNIQNGNALGATSAGTTVASGATLQVQGGFLAASEPLTLSGNGVSGSGALESVSGTTFGFGAISLAASTQIDVDDGALSLTGVVSGSGGLTKTGSGTLQLSNSNTYTGATILSGGAVFVQNTQPSSAITVNSGATIGGSGTIGAVTVAGGTVSPGSSPAILTTNGNVTFSSTSTYRAELNGLTAGTNYDQLNVTGTVSLGNCTLVASLGFVPTTANVGASFTIIRTMGGVSGTFAGLANGAVFAVGTDFFKITYTSADVILSVFQLGSATSVVSSVNPSIYGQSLTFTATVAPVNPTSGTPSGSVTFKDGATTLGSAAISSGTAVFTVEFSSPLSAGSHSITAVYTGDTNYATSTSSVLTQVVNKDPSETLLLTTGSPSVYGQVVTFTSIVSPTDPGSGTATGTVTFKDGSTVLGEVALTGSGVALFTTGAFTLNAGVHVIAASYAGDGNFTASEATIAQTVNAAFTTTTMTSVTPSVYGQAVTFSATVTANAPGSGTPTGSVTFKNNGADIGSGTLNGSGLASFTTGAFALAVGSHNITAVYSGSSNYGASGSASVAQIVNPAATTATVTSSMEPVIFGQPVTFTATVSPAAPGSGTPTGLVTFKNGVTTLGTASLNGAGVASFTTGAYALAAGSRSISVSYAGDGNYSASDSKTLTQTVNTSLFGPAANFPSGLSPQQVVVGDFNADGKLDLVTADAGANTVGVRLGNGNGLFAGAVTYLVGAAPASVTVGDFNADGKPDLAVANFNGNNLSILLGAGSGTFGGATNYAVGTAPFFATIGDLNGDGKLDLVSANYGSNNVSVLLGNGNGTFPNAINTVVGSGPFSVTVADFNGDGKQDLATANYNVSTASVLMGNGNGTFLAAANRSLGAGPFSVAAGDFNGDGKPDLASANFDGKNASVLLNAGNGTFGTLVNYALGAASEYVAIGDFNGDSQPDLAIAVTYGNSIGVLLGNGNGTFRAPVNYGAGLHPVSVAVGDFNADGRSDVAASNYDDNNVSVLLNQSGTTTVVTSATNPAHFGQSATFTATVAPVLTGAGVPSGTVTFKDGLTTLGTATLSGGVATFTSSTLGVGSHSITATYGADANFSASASTAVVQSIAPREFGAATNFAAGSSLRSVLAGDFNGDGKLDLVATGPVDGDVGVRLGAGDGTFGGSTTFAAGPGAFWLATADFNGDLKNDLAVANSGTNAVSILLGSGTGAFAAPTNFAVGQTPLSVAVGDFNGDGKQDLVTANVNGANVSVLLGSGNGAFGAATAYVVGPGPYSVAVGDVDGDSKLDLAVANSGSNNVSVLLGNGNGVFRSATNFNVGATPQFVAIADVNGDGKLDLLAANSENSTIGLLVGNGNGTFKSAVAFTVGVNPRSVTVADVDRDGKPDLVVANNGASNVSVLLGNGNGTFQTAIGYGAGTSPRSVAVGDFDQDGIPDLAVANSTSNDVSVLINLAPDAPQLTASNDSGSSSGDRVTKRNLLTFEGTGPASSNVSVYANGALFGQGSTDSAGKYAVTGSLSTDGAYAMTVQFSNATGFASPYSPPMAPQLVLDTAAPTAPSAPDLTIASDTGVSSTDNITSVAAPFFQGTAEPGALVQLFVQNAGTTTQQAAADQVNRAIPAVGTGGTGDPAKDKTVSTLTVSGVAADAVLSDLNVTVTLTHSFDADLIVTLIGPDGSTAVLSRKRGSSGNDYTGTVFDDQASTAISLGSAPFAGAFRPESPLTTFNGQSPNGLWTLAIEDTFSFDSGMLTSWSLTFQTSRALGQAVADGAGNYQVQALPALTEGAYSIQAVAVDVAGNPSFLSAAMAPGFVLDATAPSAPSAPDLIAADDTGASNTDNLTNVSTPRFQGMAEANALVQLLVDGVVTATGFADNSGNYSIPLAFALSAGAHIVRAVTFDLAGNSSPMSAALTPNLTIDTIAPAAPAVPTLAADSDSGPSKVDHVTNQARPTFSGSAEAGAVVQILANGILVAEIAADGGGAYATQLGSSLADGTYTVVVRATDAAGNVSALSPSLSPSLAIDTSSPAAPGVPDLVAADDTGASNTDNATSVTTPRFEGTAEPGATILLFANGSLVGQATADGLGNYVLLPSSPLADGTYAMTARGTDLAGNVGPMSAALSPALVVNTSNATISGLHFQDANGNGVKDSGEPTLSGWVVFLDTNGNGALDGGEQSLATDANGAYSFGSLASGTYKVREVAQAGWTQTTPNPADVVLSVGAAAVGVNFGSFRYISVAGTAFQDSNGNGAKDGGEPGLSGWSIFLDLNNNGILNVPEPSTTTDANGVYAFSNLGPGSYQVREVPQSGWLQTTAVPASIAASSGSDVANVNFGNFQHFTITGKSFRDVNGNGTEDVEDAPLLNSTVFLDTNNNGSADVGEASVTTDANGAFAFLGLGPGTYRVRTVAQGGSVPTTAPPADVVAGSGQTAAGLKFGNFQLFAIRGQKFQDINSNGVKDGSDSGVTGWTIFLDVNDNGALDPGETSATTDGNGDYTLANLGPGSYRVREAQQAGWTQTTPNPGIVIGQSGTDAAGVNFGNHQQAVNVDTTVSLVADRGTIVFGQSIQLTATVSVVPPGVGTPQGNVTFAIDGVVQVAKALSNGTVVFDAVGLSVGAHTISGSYGGATGFNPSSASVPAIVDKAATDISVTSLPPASVFGQVVQFTVTVAPVAPGAGAPTGNVTLSNGVVSLAGPLSGGSVVLSTANLGVGSHAFTASYAGDGGFASSSKPSALTQVVDKSATTTALTSSSGNSFFGESVTFTATVSATGPGAGTPEGTITFKDGAEVLGTRTLSNGSASIAIANRIVGSHSIVATYEGEARFFSSDSTPRSLDVDKAGTSVALTPSSNPARYGQAITFTAVVNVTAPGAGSPGGSVTFLDGATAIANKPVVNGVATFTTSSLSLGDHVIRAAYDGDSGFAPSLPVQLTQSVIQSATTTALSSSVNPASFGQAIDLTVQVGASSPGSGVPSGSVTFKEGEVVLGSADLSGGSASLRISTLTVGSHSIVANYGGDANFSASATAAPFALTVVKATTEITVSPSVNSTVFGQPIVFTSQVSAVGPGAGAPGGSVTFKDGAAVLGSGVLSPAGIATFSTSSLAVGDHSITAQYAGDGSFTSSATVQLLTIAVAQASTVVTLVSSANPSTAGQSIELRAQVSPSGAGAGTATGTVTFADGANALATLPLVNGVAILNTAALTVGAHALVATYNGDVNFLGSVSATVTQTVNPSNTIVTRTWTGGGSDQKWTNPDNWGGQAPNPGDDLVFGGGTQRHATNDFATETLFRSIRFDSDGFALDGNAVILGAGIADASEGNNRVGIDLILAAAQSVTVVNASAHLLLDGTIQLGANTLTVESTGLATLARRVSGAGGLLKQGTGTLALGGSNDYGGLTSIKRGVLLVQHALGLGAAGSGTTVVSGAALHLGDGVAVAAEPLSLAGNGLGSGAFVGVSGLSTWGGPVALAGDAAIGVTGDSLTLAGIVSGTATLTKTGGGTLVLRGDNTFGGETFVNAGVARLEHDRALGSASKGTTVAAGAELLLAGGVRISGEALTLTGSSAIPALSSAAGLNTWAGPIAMTSDVTIRVDDQSLTLQNGVTGSAAGLTKTGPGTLVLSVANSYGSDTFVNQGALRILHAQALGGQARGTTVATGAALQLVGGLDVGAEALELNGAGAGAGALESVDGNNSWAGPVKLATNSSLGVTAGQMAIGGAINGAGGLTKLGPGTLGLSGDNQYTGPTSVAAGTLQVGASRAVSAVSAGWTVAGGATLDVNDFSANVSTLAGAGRVTLGVTGGSLTIGGGGASTVYSGVISGVGSLSKTGGGTLTLTGPNSFVGPTTIGGGVLRTGAADVIPDTSAVTVSSGAALDVSGGNDTIGSLDGTGNVTLGQVTLTIGANNTSTTFGGAVSGPGGLAKVGNGSTTLAKQTNNDNSYAGPTNVNAGVLRITDSGSLGISGPGGGTVVAAGATLLLQGDLIVTEGLKLAGTLSASGNSAWTGDIEFANGTIRVDGASLALTGILTGAGGFTKTGARDLVLQPAGSAYAGETIIDQGKLVVGVANALGTAAAGTRVKQSAFLEFRGAAAIQYNEQEKLTLEKCTVIVNQAGDNSFAGDLELLGNSTIEVQAGRLTLSGAISAGAFTLVIKGAGVAELEGTITGTGRIEVRGQKTILRGVSDVTFIGVTRIYNGSTLFVNGRLGGEVQIEDGATLGGKDGVVGKIVVEARGVLSPGESPGTLSAANGITFLANGTTQFELIRPTGDFDPYLPPELLMQDRVVVKDGTLDLSQGPQLNLVVPQRVNLQRDVSIVLFDNKNPVVGRFRDLDEGAVVNLGNFGTLYRITYFGGADRNDIVLTRGIPTSTTLATSTTSVAPGQSLQATATVRAATPGAPKSPGGKTILLDGGTGRGDALVSGGQAGFTLGPGALGVGLHNFQAAYQGDDDFQPSTSVGVVGVTVQAPPATQFGAFSLAANSILVSEKDGNVTFTVSRIGGGDGAVTVDYAITAASSLPLRLQAALDRDIQGALSGKLSFAAGETAKAVTIPLVNDNLVEDDESFVVSLGNAMGGAALGSPAGATVTIRDDDLPSVPNEAPPAARLELAGSGFGKSTEHYQDFVAKAYARFLGRAADAAGFEYWVGLMQLYETSNHQRGLRQEQIEAGFIASPEYEGRYGGTAGEAWIRGIYKDLLGRTADENGVAFWLAQRAAGVTADNVALGFTSSDERLKNRVKETYRTLLEREADDAGLAYWVAIFKSGGTTEDINSGFVGSPEYYTKQNRGNNNPAQWTRSAYLDILFRPAATSEIDYWLRFLKG